MPPKPTQCCTCPGCKYTAAKGNFCARCGTRLPATPTTTSTSSTTRTGAGRTVDALQQRSAVTTKTTTSSQRGEQVRRDIASAYEDLYAQENNKDLEALSVQGRVGKSASFSKGPILFQNVDPQHAATWFKGPKDAEGRVVDVAERNVLCMDVRRGLGVVGSADHGLKVFNVATGRVTRTLFSKRFGHTEWVTSCALLNDGRVVSGGMDNKLCLWHSSAVKCDDLVGHNGSVSQVAANDASLVISSSYDRTLRLWDCANASRSACVGALQGHADAVTMFNWSADLVVSGDRGGGALAWDLETGQAFASVQSTKAPSSAKRAQITAVGSFCSSFDGSTSPLSLIGDQAGALFVYDLRRSASTKPIFHAVLHPGGALTALATTSDFSGASSGDQSATPGNLIVTAGADKKILCLEPRMNFEPVATFAEHKDYIYSLTTYGHLVVSGAGNGWVLVHDPFSRHGGKSACLYGLGAGKNAVRCLHASPEHLVAVGDDGQVVCYDF